MASNVSRKTSVPTSALLQDMLREKKAHTSRAHKTHDFDEEQKNRLDDREVQSSPIASRDRSGAPGRHVSGVGARQVSIPKEMNVKELDQQISKLKKQNFDLKLEVFHRRQRNEVLESNLEKYEALEADNEEMQSINEDLLLELEKRDVAVQEAVNLICELEAKIEEMGEAELYFNDPIRTPRPLIVNDEVEDLSSHPRDGRQSPSPRTDPQTEAQTGKSPSRAASLSPPPANTARRIPSFLRDYKKSTNMLRNLYSNEASVERPGSVFSGDYDEEEEEDPNMLSSPRLSILSESGFSSIYGDLKDFEYISPAQANGSHIPHNPPSPSPSQPAQGASPQDNQRGARLQKWIEERNRPTTPTRPSPKAAINDHFSSIGEVLEEEPNATEDDTLIQQDLPILKERQARSPAKSERKGAREHQRRPSSPAFGGPMFGGAMLPPTPGTMSTATIAGNSSTPSIVTEKSLLDGTPFPAKGYSALIPDVRPQSSDSDFINRLNDALTIDDGSDGEPESPSRSRSPKSTRIAKMDAPKRPSLTTSATETVFSGEAYATTRPSRTLSYPSPAGRVRRPSNQLLPTPEKSFGSVGDRSSSLAQKNRSSGRSATVTPSKGGNRDSRTRSPPANEDPATPVASHLNPQTESDPKLGRSASLRSKINKLSLTPSQSANKSVASRLFRRTHSQSIQAPSSTQKTTPSKPPVAREISGGPARLPRPSSLYGSSPIYGQRPIPTRAVPSHQMNEPKRNSDPDNKYNLSPMIPDARPGTADNTENAGETSGIPVNLRRHSTVLSSGDDVWKVDERGDVESRQTIRTDDGKGKWGLGRNASAKLREGFGFKRTISTQ